MAKYIVQHRRGTTTQWADKHTIIPMEGEIVIEIDEVNTQHKLKIGDGIHTYAELAYLQAGDVDITQALAKVKPRVITVTLTSNWTKTADDRYSQVVDIDDVTVYSRLDLQPSADMLAEFKQLGLVFVTENNGGTITVYSVGNIPLETYTMQATLVETECDGQEAVVGIPVGTPVAQADWNQTDEVQADFIKNKPDIDQIVAEKTTYTNAEPLIKDIGGILADKHTNGFENVPIDELITELLYPYTRPDVGVLTLNPTAGAKEKNVTLAVNTASVKVTKKSKSITSVDLYKDNELVQTKTDTISSSGTNITFNINETLNGTTDTSYCVKVTDADGVTVSSGEQKYSFVYPYFYGVVNNGASIDANTILGMEKVVRGKGNHTKSYTTNNQCPVIAYPKSYGTLKSIVDPNNFIQEWPYSTVTLTNTTINGVDYYVYVGGASTATATYNFNY